MFYEHYYRASIDLYAFQGLSFNSNNYIFHIFKSHSVNSIVFNTKWKVKYNKLKNI